MGLLARNTFARGWVPDSDRVNGPADGLLRMDNLVLDELGVVALRAGSAKVNGSPLADLDVHSLATFVLNGTRYRMAGAGQAVYANGSSIASGLGSASGDTAFGSHLGQILFARGSATKKYDGTLRNWGIAMSGGAPTMAAIASDGKTFASFDSGESPAFTYEEDDGTGPGFAAGQDGTSGGALVLNPDTSTQRGSITKQFGSAQDFTSYDSGGVGTDNDLLQFWVYVTEPNALLSIALMIDVNPSSHNPFQDDYYTHNFAPGDLNAIAPNDATSLPPSLANQGPAAETAITNAGDRGGTGAQSRVPVTGVSPAKPVANSGWSKLSVRRGDMTRTGSTSGKDWTTVSAVRLVVQMTKGGDPIEFDLLRIVANPLSGAYKFLYVYAFNSGTYVGLSAPSQLSALQQFQAQGATVTVPSDGGRDGQVNECWVYMMGGVMDAFYRVAVKTGVSGTGSFNVTVSTSDLDAMVANIKVQTDNGVPPSGILSIAGPYYDRTFALTLTSLYPSRRLNPDSFAAGQVILVAGADETCLWVKKAYGGLYVGTTKDIYRLDGDGAELPDGTINFTKTPLNIDHPPLNDGVAQDGNLLIYFAADGWRALNGASSVLLTADTSLLYRGKVRHGLGPINTVTGRFRAAISRGQMVVLAPMGAETTSTVRVMRHVPTRAGWYYASYVQPFRVVYSEPDGTLIAGDTAGTVWQLDTGVDDGGTAILFTLWTKVDDNGTPYQRKDPWDVRARLDTGGTVIDVAILQDGSEVEGMTYTPAASGEGLAPTDLSLLVPCFQLQLRAAGFVRSFHFYDFAIAYRDHPILSYFVEQKPVPPSSTRRRFSGITALIDTLGGAATVTPMLDNVAQTPFSVSTPTAEGRSLSLPAVVGRDLWARVESVGGFELYDVTPRIIETLPPVVQGVLPKTNAGYSGVKTLSGVRLRACTLAVTRLVTVYLDNVAIQTFPIKSGANDPDDFTLPFPAAQTARDFTIGFDGDVELYEWAPIVTTSQPLGVLAWDSGPIDLGDRDLVWIRRIDMKVNASAALTVTIWLDGVVVTAVSVPVTGGADTVYNLPVPRGTKGRQPRLVVTSTGPFFPYWLRVVERVTGLGTEKMHPTVPATLGGAQV